MDHNFDAFPTKKVIKGIVFRKTKFLTYEPENLNEIVPRIRIRKPEDSLPFLASIRGRKQECFCVLSLDGSHQVIKAHEITVGLADRSQIHPRETFVCAIEDRAVSIMIAHNHPSGCLEASVNDLLATRRLVEAGQLLRIPVVDHLIVVEIGFISLREKHPEYFMANSI